MKPNPEITINSTWEYFQYSCLHHSILRPVCSWTVATLGHCWVRSSNCPCRQLSCRRREALHLHQSTVSVRLASMLRYTPDMSYVTLRWITFVFKTLLFWVGLKLSAMFTEQPTPYSYNNFLPAYCKLSWYPYHKMSTIWNLEETFSEDSENSCYHVDACISHKVPVPYWDSFTVCFKQRPNKLHNLNVQVICS
jgi:hypothetical protein